MNVERSADVQLFGDLATDLFDAASGFEVNLLGREYQCRVTGVHAGEFDVFRDRVIDDLTGVRYRVELDLFCIFEEFGDHDRILFRHLRGDAEEMFHLLFGVADAHGGSRKHVGRTDQYREAYAVDEFVHVVHRRKLFPLRLVDAKVVEHRREFVPVLCTVDRNGRRPEDGYILALEFHGQVVRYLAADRNHHAVRLFEVDYVEYAFFGQFVEIEPVAHVVVGRDRLRVVVDHDRRVTELACGLHGVDRAPVELDGAADAVSARTEYHDRFFIVVVRDIVFGTVVSQIKVVGQFGML